MQVRDVDVQWYDSAENPIGLHVKLNRKPKYGPYEKRPSAAEQLSDEQQAIVGRPRPMERREGWHIYLATDEFMATFFTWGGKPDDGFGGSKRTVNLSDGTQEEVVGGWHVGPAVATAAGFPEYVPVAYSHPGNDREPSPSGWGRWPKVTCMAAFMLRDHYENVVAEFLPEMEVQTSRFGTLTLGFKDYPTKDEWRAMERERIAPIRAEFKSADRKRAVAADVSVFSWEAWRCWEVLTDDEKDELRIRPYSQIRELTDAEVSA